MPRCQHEGCTKEALYKSEFCWVHIQDKEAYSKRIVRRGKHKRTDLRAAYLDHANLCLADLRRANLRKAHLAGVNLCKAELQEADLSMAIIGRADVRRADLRKAKLWKATLMGADLSQANITGANLGRGDLRQAKLWRTNLERTNLSSANLRAANFMRANLREVNLCNADLRNATLNNANLSGATLTGAKVWGMSHAGCKTDGIKAEYLNFDKDGKDSGIVHLNKEQVDEFFSSQPTIEILLQNKLPPYAIRTLLDLIEKINKQNPDWGVELRKFTSGSFLSELMFKTSKDEILDELAKIILAAFNESFQQKLLEYLPEKKASEERGLILKKLGKIEKRIENPVQQVTIIRSTGQIPVNIDFREAKVGDVKITGKKVKIGKIINVDIGGNLYNISVSQGRDDLVRNLLNQLDSPEIDKRIKEAEAELKGLSPEQVKFLEEQFKKSVEKIFKAKQKEVGFFDKVKVFSQRLGESAASGVISSAIWHVIQNYLPTRI